jgi:hypothetical protein
MELVKLFMFTSFLLWPSVKGIEFLPGELTKGMLSLGDSFRLKRRDEEFDFVVHNVHNVGTIQRGR